jgi:hypothetical protein
MNDLNSKPQPEGNYFDEQYNHMTASDNDLLETLVENDMKANGYDPKNTAHVRAYWRKKDMISRHG